MRDKRSDPFRTRRYFVIPTCMLLCECRWQGGHSITPAVVWVMATCNPRLWLVSPPVSRFRPLTVWQHSAMSEKQLHESELLVLLSIQVIETVAEVRKTVSIMLGTEHTDPFKLLVLLLSGDSILIKPCEGAVAINWSTNVSASHFWLVYLASPSSLHSGPKMPTKQ